MNLSGQLAAFGKSLDVLLQVEDSFETKPLYDCIRKANHYNHWFSEDAVVAHLKTIASFLQSNNFDYQSKTITNKIAFISEERIPLEEFSNILTAILYGNSVVYKEAKKHDCVMKYVMELLLKAIPEIKENFSFEEGVLPIVDSYYISSREPKPLLEQKYYLNKKALFEARYQSVAVLDSTISDEELKLLALDVFDFYGQSCASVRKIYIPENFDIRRIYEPFEIYSNMLNHNAYANNFQYNQSVYLLNRIPHYDNGFLLLKEDKSRKVPTGVVFYDFYKDKITLLDELDKADFFKIYTSSPRNKKELTFGSSKSQLLGVSEIFIEFVK